MEILVPIIAAAVAAVIVVIVMRSAMARQLAESRASAAAELAAAQQALLEKADQRLRDTFQSLSAQALNDNRPSFFGTMFGGEFAVVLSPRVSILPDARLYIVKRGVVLKTYNPAS